MYLVCINKNGWYLDKDNAFMFLGPRPSEVNGPLYGDIVVYEGTVVEYQGDLCYLLKDFPGRAWDAEAFSPALSSAGITAVQESVFGRLKHT